MPVTPVDTHASAAWIREITDLVAIAKSRNRMAEITRLLRAIFSRKFTSATLSLPEPVPFFAEFSLWISSEVYHGNKKRRISSSLTLAMRDLNNRSRERKEYLQRRTPPMLQRRRMFVLRSRRW
jgi:hypothetical protein